MLMLLLLVFTATHAAGIGGEILPESITLPLHHMLDGAVEPIDPFQVAAHRSQKTYLIEWITRSLLINGCYTTMRAALRPELVGILQKHGFTVTRVDNRLTLILFPDTKTDVNGVSAVTHDSETQCHLSGNETLQEENGQ